VVDNASTDGSALEVSKRYPQAQLISSDTNLGFAAGNNLGVKQAEGDYILFLNDDTIIKGDAIQQSLEYLQNHSDVGAVTGKVELPNGKMDYSCHRGLPTPWNALCYFSGLSKLFPETKLFAGYPATYLNLNTVHEIDCATGAYLLVKKEAGEQIGWWDEDYFWNGEDIEFCYQLRQKNWKIVFLPHVKVTHFKGSSSGLWSSGKSMVSAETKIAAARSAAKAMRVFYGKHFKTGLLGMLVWWGIVVLEQLRLVKLRLGFKYA
jgi:GT2 family glycosyltransferase